mgnify:CR=1 FL=1
MKQRFISPWFPVAILLAGLLPLGAASPAVATLLAAVILYGFLTFIIATAQWRRGSLAPTLSLGVENNTGLWAVVALPALVYLQIGLGAFGPSGMGPVSTTTSSASMIVALACFYVLARNSLTQTRDLKIFITGLVIITSLEAAYGILNLLGGNERLLFYPRWAYHDSATGTLVNKNHFAYLMELGLPLSVAFVTWFAIARRDHSPHIPAETGARKILAGSMVILAGLGLVFSGSRMGIVSFIVATAAVLILNTIVTESRRNNSTQRKGSGRVGLWLIGLATTGYALVIGLDPVLERFLHVGSDLEAGRWPIWQIAIEMFSQRPVLGHGWGSFEHLAPAYREVPSGLYYTHAHSEYLEVAAEAGIVGLMLVAWLIFLFARRLLITLALPLTPLQRTTVVALGIAITSVLLHSTADFGLRIPGVALAFVYVVALFVRITDDPSLVDGLAISRQQADS